jgi:hypothetical protein
MQGYKARMPRMKISFWLDADVYEKLQALKGSRRYPRYADILVDAIHQYVVKYSANFPPRRRISVSLPRNIVYVLRLAKLKLHVTERDIVNISLRAYSPEEPERSPGAEHCSQK